MGTQNRPRAKSDETSYEAISPARSSPSTHSSSREESAEARAAARMLVQELFSATPGPIPNLDYAVAYQLAQGHAGGDIADVYRSRDGTLALSLADISGRGLHAAVQASLIKYGLRAFISDGSEPAKALSALDHLYFETNSRESEDSFATLFLASVQPGDGVMTYASAAHEPVFLMHPGEPPTELPVTGPLLGAFEESLYPFEQRSVELRRGSVLLAATDGVVEARRGDDFFGMERLREVLEKCGAFEMETLSRCVLEEVLSFCAGRNDDDIAVLAVRFL